MDAWILKGYENQESEAASQMDVRKAVQEQLIWGLGSAWRLQP